MDLVKEMAGQPAMSSMDDLRNGPVEKALISVTIVCYNGAADIRRCMAALLNQSWPHVEVIAIDNASKDDSVAIFREYPSVRLIASPVNTGFSAAQNLAIREARGDWIVCLNLDTQAEPTFLEEMLVAMQIDPRIGTVCPKIMRMNGESDMAGPQTIDSTGCYATPDMRHHNRGSQAVDRGQFDEPCYVFGYTGAAAMFRRAMLDDLAIDGMVLDEDFFVYREDSDLSWRAQIAGWRCLYTPYSVISHRRHVFEDNRKRVSPLINMHSTKNRFLLRINNLTPRVTWKTLIPATIRDAGVFVYVLIREQTSLPGLIFLVRERKRLFAKRSAVMAKRRVSDAYLCQWFAWQPVTLPLEPNLRSRLDLFRGVGSELEKHGAAARQRIGIDLHALEGLRQGSRTHTLELFSRVASRMPEADFFFFVDTALMESVAHLFTGDNARVVHMPQRNSWFRLAIQLPALTKQCAIDLLHVQYIRPPLLWTHTAVTIHDLLPEDCPQYFGTFFRLRSKLLFRISAKSSSLVCTVSNYSKGRIRKIYDVAEAKLHMVGNGVNLKTFHPGAEGLEQVGALGIRPGEYILTVGRLEPRKNHLGLLRAYAAMATPRPKLAIVGQRDFGYRSIFDACEDLCLQDEVVFLETADDFMLAALYRHARLFVYPTFAEGFGLPVLEAMASGVPVITSDRTSMPEVVGDAGILVDPHSDKAICDAMERVLGDDALAARMRSDGLRRAAGFTWELSAELQVAAYREYFNAP